jgi:SAM-dependent methyltransferase
VDVLSRDAEQFDIVTVSHVIEHLHSPRTLLSNIFDLLKPGGLVYIDTPNIGSAGHKRFTNNWLHLDPPRHLVIFNRRTLMDLLSRTGFEEIQSFGRPEVIRGSYIASRRLELGANPFDAAVKISNLMARLFSLKSFLNKSEPEYLTLLARKSVCP